MTPKTKTVQQNLTKNGRQWLTAPVFDRFVNRHYALIQVDFVGEHIMFPSDRHSFCQYEQPLAKAYKICGMNL